MKDWLDSNFDKKSFLKPRAINIVDVVVFILIIAAFYYPSQVDPWYKIREAYNMADDAYGLAEEAYNLAEEAQSTAENAEWEADNARSDLRSHEIWSH